MASIKRVTTKTSLKRPYKDSSDVFYSTEQSSSPSTRTHSNSTFMTAPSSYDLQKRASASYHGVRVKNSNKSLVMSHKSLDRDVKTIPPTTSVNHLFNEEYSKYGSSESLLVGAQASAIRTQHQQDMSSGAKLSSSPLESLLVGAQASAIRAKHQQDISLGAKLSSTHLKDSRDNSNNQDTHVDRRYSESVFFSGHLLDQESIETVQIPGTVSSVGVTPPLESLQGTTDEGLWTYSKMMKSPLGISWSAWICLLIGSACFVAIALTSMLFVGVVCGSLITFMVLRTYTWLLNPDLIFVYLPSITDDDRRFGEAPLQNLPKNSNESTEESVREFQGWLNLLETQEYNPETYHISNTETVFVRLEGTSFRMKKPLEVNIPKRAVWNESVHNITFVKQVQIDMRNYIVELQPAWLPQSRLYSKRFPICLIHRRSVHDDKLASSLFDKYRVTAHKKTPDVIVLFARTNREKEEWFRRLEQASRGFPITTMVLELQRLLELRTEVEDLETVSIKAKSSRGIPSVTASPRKQRETLFDRDHMELLIDYMKYMTSVINRSAKVERADTARSVHLEIPVSSRDLRSPERLSLASKRTRSRSKSPQDGGATKKPSHTNEEFQYKVSITDCDTGTIWVNALLQRIFFDFFREEYWRVKIQAKIQRKIDKINLPYYLGPLILSELGLGTSLPLIKRIGQPYLSDDGLWVDSQIAYSGGVQMTLETKINLNRLKKEEGNVEVKRPSVKANVSSAKHETEDTDDSSTSSEESDVIPSPLDKDPKKGEHTITRFFNTLKSSKYFQKLADTKLVRSAMDKVSNTPIKLTVEVKYLAGLFSVNIAPPPTDRLWFGFRGAPDMVVSAKPVVGEKSVNLTKLSVWIEEKLITEFQREFVIPNMVDRKVPVMCGNYKRNSKRPKPSTSTTFNNVKLPEQ